MTQTLLQPPLQPFPQPVVRRELLIDAPLDYVWQLVATEDGLRQWWGNPIALEAQEGGRCQEWRTQGERATHWQGVVTLYAPPHQLMLTLQAQSPQQGEPELTTIAFSLSAHGTQTRVQVTQRLFGIPASGTELSQISNQEQIAPPLPNTNPHWPPAAHLGDNSNSGATLLPQRAAGAAPQTTPVSHVIQQHVIQQHVIQQAWDERLATLIIVTNALTASLFTASTFQSKR